MSSFLFFGRITWHAESWFPDQSNPCPLHWEHRVLTTGPSGKSQEQGFKKKTLLHTHVSSVPETEVTVDTQYILVDERVVMLDYQ